MKLSQIHEKIFELRSHKIMLDFDLATLYETETKYLKRAVRNNLGRFPPDFMFELTVEEWESLRCKFSTSKKSGRGGVRYLPFAFTEQGVAMLSSVLNSEKAIDINIAIMRVFVFVRQYALGHNDLIKRLNEIEFKYNRQFKDVYDALGYLMNKDKQEEDQGNRKRIGFR